MCERYSGTWEETMQKSSSKLGKKACMKGARSIQDSIHALQGTTQEGMLNVANK